MYSFTVTNKFGNQSFMYIENDKAAVGIVQQVKGAIETLHKDGRDTFIYVEAAEGFYMFYASEIRYFEAYKADVAAQIASKINHESETLYSEGDEDIPDKDDMH